tara:strand:- start:288 stop:416 length:129 start_codon:yes stop_codon:yes gene_type:complete
MAQVNKAAGGMVLPQILVELQQKIDANATEIKKIEQEYQKVL